MKYRAGYFRQATLHPKAKVIFRCTSAPGYVMESYHTGQTACHALSGYRADCLRLGQDTADGSRHFLLWPAWNCLTPYTWSGCIAHATGKETARWPSMPRLCWIQHLDWFPCREMW